MSLRCTSAHAAEGASSFGLQSPDFVMVWEDRGAAVLPLIRIGADDAAEIVGWVALDDSVRPATNRAVKHLQRRGAAVVMIIGNARRAASSVAADLGIDEVIAEVLPEDKEARIAELEGVAWSS